MGNAWIPPGLHSPNCTLSGQDINTLYIRETINGKQQFIPMGAFCRCCKAFEIKPGWDHKNDQKFEIVRRRIPTKYSKRRNEEKDS